MTVRQLFLFFAGWTVVAFIAWIALRWLVRWLAANDRRLDGDTLIQCSWCHEHKPKRELVLWTDYFGRAAYRCADTDHCRPSLRSAS